MKTSAEKTSAEETSKPRWQKDSFWSEWHLVGTGRKWCVTVTRAGKSFAVRVLSPSVEVRMRDWPNNLEDAQEAAIKIYEAMRKGRFGG
jgi:hypothetical protein